MTGWILFSFKNLFIRSWPKCLFFFYFLYDKVSLHRISCLKVKQTNFLIYPNCYPWSFKTKINILLLRMVFTSNCNNCLSVFSLLLVFTFSFDLISFSIILSIEFVIKREDPGDILLKSWRLSNWQCYFNFHVSVFIFACV